MKGREIMSELSALVGIDFSLLKTKLYAAYEKNGEEGYSVLLMPREQEADNRVTLGDIIKEINKLSGQDTTSEKDTSVETGISDSLGSLEVDKDGIGNMEFKLCMAYLYWDKKTGKEATLEYAFKLQILTEDVVPTEIQSIVNVDRVMISVWKTDRPKVINEMALISIKEFIEG